MTTPSTPEVTRKSAAVRLLAGSAGRVRVHPGCIHELTLMERLAVETRSMQRMTRLRQTGLAFLTIPTNENTRLVHCMGTGYWAARFLDRMRTNDGRDEVGDRSDGPKGNVARLEHLDALLGPDLSLDLVVRLYAITHDADLLPFGHTLSYQLGYYEPPGAVPRFQAYLSRILDEAAASPLLDEIGDIDLRDEVRAGVRRHFAAVEAVAASVVLLSEGRSGHLSLPEAEIVRLLPVCTFVETLVTATVSTDLLDFALRDTLGAAIPWEFDTGLLDAARVFATPVTEAEASVLLAVDGGAQEKGHLYRFGLSGHHRGVRDHAAISGVVDLLRVRYLVLEQIVYSPGKLAADAMLDKAIRNLNAHHVGQPIPEDLLLDLGDDQFLDLVEAEEAKASLPPGASPVLSDLRSRRLFTEAYRLEDRDRLSPAGQKLLSQARVPVERDIIEEELSRLLPGSTPTDIIVSCLPLSMQMKEPDTLIGWSDGVVLPLSELAERTGCGVESIAITSRYSTLWSLSVFARYRDADRIRAVREAASRLFEH